MGPASLQAKGTKSISFLMHVHVPKERNGLSTLGLQRLGPGVGFGGAGGVQGVKKYFFSNIVMWHIK